MEDGEIAASDGKEDVIQEVNLQNFEIQEEEVPDQEQIVGEEPTEEAVKPQSSQKRKRKSVEDIEKEIREVNRAVAKMQRMMENGAYLRKEGKRNGLVLTSPSNSTIYKNAIGPKNTEPVGKRVSTSSEEGDDEIDNCQRLNEFEEFHEFNPHLSFHDPIAEATGERIHIAVNPTGR